MNYGTFQGPPRIHRAYFHCLFVVRPELAAAIRAYPRQENGPNIPAKSISIRTG